MKLLCSILSSLLVMGGVASAEGSKVQNKLSCRWESKVFGINPDGNDQYNVSITDEKFASNFTYEEMKKQLPELDDKMLRQMAEQAQKMNVGTDNFGKCSQMKECEFFEVGSPTLVVCTTKLESSTNTLTISAKHGFYGVTCTSDGALDSKTMGMEFKGTGKSTSTYRLTIPMNACVYQ